LEALVTLSAFDRALAFVLHWEGGYINDPRDPGGETNHGISKRAYPELDIAALAPEDVVEIYRRDYWTPAACEHMPSPLALLVFDAAVNQGVERAVRCLQEACGAAVDGVPGPNTLEAARRAWGSRPERLLREMALHRLLHYTSLPRWSVYGSNWGRRLLDALVTAVQSLEPRHAHPVATDDPLAELASMGDEIDDMVDCEGVPEPSGSNRA
jgi:lysozyme family protein